jgi:hypothetical protein
MFELFKVVRLYLKDGILDPTLIYLLSKKRKIDFEDALIELPLILSGYLSVLYPPEPVVKEQTYGRPESNDVYD